MQTLQLRLPDFVDIDAQELTLILASRLYEQGKLSIGQAAELAGLPKRAFMELLGRANVSAFNYDADDLERDMRNALEDIQGRKAEPRTGSAESKTIA